MERLDDLPVTALLNVLSFLYGNVAANISNRKRSSYRQSIRGLASVSTSWLSAIETVEAYLRDSVLVFDFQQAPEAVIEMGNEEIPFGTIAKTGEVVATNEVQSGLLYHLARGLFSAFACSSRHEADRVTRSLPEEEESIELIELKHKKIQKKHEALNAENELKRLLEEVTNEKQRLRAELWMADPHDVTICSVDDKCDGDILLKRWGDIFLNCEHLVRLDLSGIPVESDHLPAILNAVGEHCAKLEELVMPQQTHLMHRRRSTSYMLEAFHAALASLGSLSRSRTGKRGGLKKLVLPSLFSNESVDATAAAIGEHCPNLKHIEGLRLAAFSRRRRLTSVEMRQSTLRSWKAFCKGCSHLTTLNWCSLPCSDDVFNIFAMYPKLELKSLVIPGNTALWRRDYILQERHDVEPLSPSNSFATVLRACPNLTSLEVLLSDMQGYGEYLGDQFLCAVADDCPLLKRLALVEASVLHGFGPNNTITSDGLEALTRLRHLCFIELNGVQVSGRVLLSLATRSSLPNQPRTRIDVTLGVRGWTAVDVATRFHETILELLGNLLAPETIKYPAFIIRVRPDMHSFSPPAMFESRYVSEWNKVKRELMRRTPNIRFHYNYLCAEATIECQEITNVTEEMEMVSKNALLHVDPCQ